MNFTDILNQELKNKGMNGAQLARALNLSRPSVHSILKGKTLPRKERIKDICKILKLSEGLEAELLGAYNLAKSDSGSWSPKPSSDKVEEIRTIFTRLGIQPIAAFENWDEPHLMFQHDSTSCRQKVGVWLAVQQVSWDRILGQILRMKFKLTLNSAFFVYSTTSGMEVKDEVKTLFNNYDIRVSSSKELETLLKEYLSNKTSAAKPEIVSSESEMPFIA